MVFRTLAVFLILALAGPGFAQPRALFSVRDFGAVGDGATLDTAAINNAIEACAKAGGGTVYVPAGTYLTGTVNLKSNMTLWLASGATLLGSKRLEDYPVSDPWAKQTIPYEGATQGSEWFRALVWGENLENVAILGPGTIDGNNVFNPHGEEHMRGPLGVNLEKCRNVTIRDLAIRNASNWSLRINSCERVNIEGYSATGGWDGINLQGSTADVTISNCRLFSGDDAIAGGAKNVTVTNSLLSSSCNAFRFRGENVVISNIEIIGPGREEHRTSHRHNTESGFTGSAAGNFIMSNVSMTNVRSPFRINVSGERAVSTTISINNLTATGVGRSPFVVTGDPAHPLKSFSLNNVHMTYVGGGDEKDSIYQGMSPYSIYPWYGLYARYVKDLGLHDVRFGYVEKDLRPALYGESIGNLELDHFVAQREAGGPPPIVLADVKRVLVDGKDPAVQKVPVKGLEVEASKIIAGEPFQTAVTVENTGAEGLGEVTLRVGNQTVVRSVWLKAGETANVRFANTIREAGEQQAQAGDFTKRFTVQPKPAGRPVSAPYLTFQNTASQLQQLDGGGFYVRAAGDDSVMDRVDQYGAIYLKGALPREGSVVVRLENPDLKSSWDGRTGIMVRNDISQAGQSAGDLMLGASPANGNYMEWDSSGKGRIDQHTEFDGYTYWPHWLKLERRGDKFTGYTSTDGANWLKVGEAEVPGAGERLDAGLFAHRSSARFEGFKVGQ